MLSELYCIAFYSNSYTIDVITQPCTPDIYNPHSLIQTVIQTSAILVLGKVSDRTMGSQGID
jgi:hypothetical protein